MSELISIVVIGRNEEKNIARCLDSCLACDWDNKEIIYCDSESTDKTVEIARQYPVRVIVHKNRRRNPSIGRNIGLKAACGNYIYFIDADMELEPGYLRKAYPILNSRSDIACVVGIRKEVNANSFYVRMIDSSYHAYSTFGEVNTIFGGGGLFKRPPLVEVGGYYERFNCSEEQILGQELRKKGYKIILIDATMAYHDVGVYTLRQFLRFRGRQGRQLANALLLNDHALESAYRVAWKHIIEVALMIGWCVGLLLLGRYLFLYTLLSAVALTLVLTQKYLTVRTRPKGRPFFIYEFILGKPFHIIFQMYYLVKELFDQNHPSKATDGQIISDTTNLKAEQ
jgi:glycosyltransferase involved in cell wall biosynthesis